MVVPEIDPDDCRAIPEGSVPENNVQLYGALPPVALNAFEYELPLVAPDKDVVVMLRVGGGPEAAVTVTAAFPDLVGSATLVAVTDAVVFVVTAGA